MWYMALIGGAFKAYIVHKGAKARKRQEYYNSAQAVENANAAKKMGCAQ